MYRALSPHVHGVLHDCHVGLALGRGVDGELSRRDDEAFTQRQPHSLSEGVGESGRDNKTGTGAVRSVFGRSENKLNLSGMQKKQKKNRKQINSKKLAGYLKFIPCSS